MNIYVIGAFLVLIVLFAVLKGVQMLIYKGNPPKPDCDDSSCGSCGMKNSCGLNGIDTTVHYTPAKREDKNPF